MPWLLHTSSGRLQFFNNPTEVRYAILSHVWRGREQSFHDLHDLMQTHDTPRDHASAKIRECCLYAERAGYKWVWIDTCCIDKTSSAELSEAINSMFTWYAQAEVCYAFLDDVMDREDPRTQGSSFRTSHWWTRGWTLQELLAPKHVVFLAQNWASIGSKTDLAETVEETSGVDVAVLLGEIPLHEVSVARRMWWASRRRTTREEDRAYSLLGMFGVNMPTIYGEGRRAFIRLQEEILKTIPDQSIFAWGPILQDYPFSCGGFAPVVEDVNNFPMSTVAPPYNDMQGLLASSPDSFANSGSMRAVSINPEFNLRFTRGIREFKVDRPTYSFTSYGIHTSLPVISYQLVPRLSLSNPAQVSVAVLACEDRDDDRLLLLLLRRKNNSPDDYHVGSFAFTDPGHPEVSASQTSRIYYRMASLAGSLGPIADLAENHLVYIHSDMVRAGTLARSDVVKTLTWRESHSMFPGGLMIFRTLQCWITVILFSVVVFALASAVKSSTVGKEMMVVASAFYYLFSWICGITWPPTCPTLACLRILHASTLDYCIWMSLVLLDVHIAAIPLISAVITFYS